MRKIQEQEVQNYEYMQKIKLEENLTRKKRFTLLTSVTIGITILLALLQLFLSNRLASFGDELALLGKTEKELAFENERLAKEVAKESSIAAISQKAQGKFLAIPASFLVVEKQESVALVSNNVF